VYRLPPEPSTYERRIILTVKDAVELFEHEMINEIFHYISDDALQDILVDAVKSSKATVLETYEAQKKLAE
jgi:hypothetical protein